MTQASPSPVIELWNILTDARTTVAQPQVAQVLRAVPNPNILIDNHIRDLVDALEHGEPTRRYEYWLGIELTRL